MKKDWDLIKTTYITSGKSLIEIAADFKAGLDNLKHRAAKESWSEQKKLFKARTQEAAVQQRSTELASESAQLASDSLKLVRAGYALVAEEMKARRPAKDIATALKGFQEAGMRALGERTGEDRESQKVEIKVISEKSKTLTESIISGKGTE